MESEEQKANMRLEIAVPLSLEPLFRCLLCR
jgi:hypothetical protein